MKFSKIKFKSDDNKSMHFVVISSGMAYRHAAIEPAIAAIVSASPTIAPNINNYTFVKQSLNPKVSSFLYDSQYLRSEILHSTAL